MLSCKDVSRLVSESLDRKLPWYRRMDVWLHLKLCRLCAGFHENLLLLRAAVRESPEAEGASPDEAEGLSSETKERLQQLISSELSDDAGP